MNRVLLVLAVGLGVGACGYSSRANLQETYVDPTFNARSVKSVLVSLDVEASSRASSSTRFHVSMAARDIVSSMVSRIKERSPNVSVVSQGSADVTVQGVLEYVSQVDGVEGVKDEEGRTSPTTKGQTTVMVRLILIDNRAGQPVWEGTSEGKAWACDPCPPLSGGKKRAPPIQTAVNPAFDQLISNLPLLGTPAAQPADVIDSVP